MRCFLKCAVAALVVVSGILYFGCESPTGASENVKIDGLTSATGQYFKIDSVRVTQNAANIYWWDHWDDGEFQLIMWGTDTKYSTDTIDALKDLNYVAETHVKTVLPNLVPKTHYYVKFYRTFGLDDGSVKFDFTTP
jgi:hypothetical protein